MKAKPITKSEWLKDVAKEVESLKTNATPQELKRLNFKKLKPESYTKCIYGQMTGNCTSKRATDLIDLCCQRFTLNKVDYDVMENKLFENTLAYINGKVNKSRTEMKITHLSALEHYIYLIDSKPENVIAYLKGETKKLVL